MIKVAILVFEDCTPISSIGAMEILRQSQAYYHPGLQANFPPPFFDVKLVSLKGKYVNASNGYPVYCHNEIAEVEKVDLVLISSLDEKAEHLLPSLADYAPWLRKQHEAGADIVSMCTGSFLLAESGLLDGKSATTHWALADQFKKRYPKVNLKSEKIIVDEGRVCTCGGALSYSNLMIYLVEKYIGKDVAINLSKFLVADLWKHPQSSYAIFALQKSHSDEVILRAQEFIEQTYNKELPIEELASRFAVSARNFIRRFKKATGNTPGQYVQRVRIEAAKKYLEIEGDSVQNITFDVGYEDMSTFRKLFKKYTGLSPVDYRKKYMRAA